MLNLKTRKLAKYPDEMKEKMNFLAPKPPRYTPPPSTRNLGEHGLVRPVKGVACARWAL